DHADSRDGAKRDVVGKSPEQDQEFADETVETGKAERREDEEAEEARVHGPAIREPAEVGDEPPVRSLVLDADAQEQRSGDETVVDHLQYRTGHALRVEHEGPGRHEAQMP